MAEKKKVSNKAEKKAPEAKEKTSAIDWSKKPLFCTIVGMGGKHLEKGKEYTLPKEHAKILVDKKVAKLK